MNETDGAAHEIEDGIDSEVAEAAQQATGCVQAHNPLGTWVGRRGGTSWTLRQRQKQMLRLFLRWKSWHQSHRHRWKTPCCIEPSDRDRPCLALTSPERAEVLPLP